MSERTIAERVAAGVALLDEHRPGWEHCTDPVLLWTMSSCNCVLGQVFAPGPDDENRQDGYWTGLKALGVSPDPVSVPAAYGFAAPTIRICDYTALDAEWTRVITERRAAA